MKQPNLALYFFQSCPFCAMVLQAAEQLGLDLELRDISQAPEHLKKLVQDTGRRTVPCLYIDNKPMFESRDIINWLKENTASLKKKA